MFCRLPSSLIMALLPIAITGCSAEPEPASVMASVIEARQENFEQMKEANDAIKREAEADSPDPAVFRANAAILIERAANIPSGFPQGSGPESGVETDALPAIWQNSEGFAARAGNMQDSLRQFGEAASGEDISATIAAVKLVGDTCRECHEEFRKRD